MPRYLDDFMPGQRFESPRRTITETDIVNNAALTGDWNPVHTDEVFASESAFGERIAVNTPIQGSAADLIKLAMIRLDRRLEQEDQPARILLQVHDELVLEVREDRLEDVSGVVREVMESVYELEVPLVVDVASGANWAEAHA